MAADDSILSEHQEQALFVQWFRREYPGVRILAIPNGGGRSRSQGAKLKVEGVSAGVPDLLIPHGMIWIEMKRAKGGTVSAVQRDWHTYLDAIGHTVIIGYGFEDARTKILLLHHVSRYGLILLPGRSGAAPSPSRGWSQDQPQRGGQTEDYAMSLHPLFAGILAAQGLPATDSHTALLRDLADFVENAGNVLCDVCHDHLSNQAGMLLKRIQRELGE